jgi:hypothetical protein
MDWLQRPKAWAAPLVGVAAASVLVALQLPSVQGGVEHPQPSTLVYLAEEPAAALPTVPGAPLAADTSRVRTMLGDWLTVPGPGEAWARSWVGQPPTGTGSTEAGILLIGADSLYEVAGTGPDSEIAPPRVSVVSRTSQTGRLDVLVSVESGLRGEMTAVHVPEGTVAELTGVGGVAWSGGGTPVRSLVHWGSPEGGAVLVGLSLPTSATETELLVLEHHLRPPEVLGPAFYERADSIVANAALGSDRVIQRTLVRLEIPETVQPADSVMAPGG